MSKMFQVYGIGQALIPVLPPPLPFQNPPNSNQTNYEIGQLVFTPPQSPTAFYLYGGAGNWIEIATNLGAILSVTGTANQITAVTTAGAVALTIPAVFIAPGSIASTTTITAATGFVATTGNLTLSGVGSGLVTTPTVVAAGASPQIANGRVFSVTFSGVSIASGATQTFVITNSAITGASTVTSLTWSGATAGSGLSVVSITPSAGSLSIVMTNATSATMVTSVANITFTGIVLN